MRRDDNEWVRKEQQDIHKDIPSQTRYYKTIAELEEGGTTMHKLHERHRKSSWTRYIVVQRCKSSSERNRR